MVVAEDELEPVAALERRQRAGEALVEHRDRGRFVVDRGHDRNELPRRALPAHPSFRAQSYGMSFRCGSTRRISAASCGRLAQFATTAGPVPSPLKPFHT